MTEITDNHRAVLRALADTIVPSMPRDDDPTGFWAASGSAMRAQPRKVGRASASREGERRESASAMSSRTFGGLGRFGLGVRWLFRGGLV